MKKISRLFLTMALLAATGTQVDGQAAGQGAPAPTAPAAEPIAPEMLDKLLAPIALYPDALVIQIVTCASSPYQVKQVSTWLKANPTLKGTAAQDAATEQGFDLSYVAIVLFPEVVHMMADKPDWTKELGQAFKSDRAGVFKSIQRLRAQAQSQGNLTTTEHQQVQTVTSESGQQVIVIQPANPQVVYVPVYNPQVVYVQPAPPPNGQVASAGLVGFAAGVIVGAAADDDNGSFRYGYGGWGYRGAAEDFYDHREDMAKDYYEHRENMSGQRGENQANRQSASAEKQAARGGTRTESQSGRQASQDANQASRSENQSGRPSGQGAQSANQGSAQGGKAPSQGTVGRQSGGAQSSSSAAGASQRSYQGKSSSPSSKGSSDAFSGYQKGSNERTSSSRGNESMARSGGGRSGGGGGGRGR